MKRLLDLCSSLRLTLALLLGLALVAIGGTIVPFAPDEIPRFDLYYRTPWFRGLLGLLALNLTACTWKTWQRSLGERARLLATLASPQLHALAPEQLRAGLAACGYQAVVEGDRVLGRRGRSRRWAVPALHVCILAIMLGAVASELGFVGTLNLYVGNQSDRYFDWSTESEQPLDFTLRLDHFEPRYYPIDLKFAVIDPQRRQLIAEYTGREGETVDLGDGLSVQLVRFFPEEQHLILEVRRDGVPLGEYHALSGQRNFPNSIDPGVLIKPVAFRDPVLKQLHSEVSILKDGQVVQQGVVEVNQPLVYRGIAIYQTAYGRTPEGFWTCGFQFSRDPGEPLVWVGSILLVLALFAVFFVRYQAVGLVRRDGGWQLIGLSGFAGEDGRERLARLARELAPAA